MKAYTPQIATHLTPAAAQATYEHILSEAKSLTEEEITQRCQELCKEADKWNEKMIHDPLLQDARDRMYERWVAEDSEMAAIWATV